MSSAATTLPALEVLNRSRNGARPNAEYDAVRGSVLSRMGRDREAVEAYRAALRTAPDKGGTWLGLALSLESLDRRSEAADAYRRALASGTLTADVKQYAEQKVGSYAEARRPARAVLSRR